MSEFKRHLMSIPPPSDIDFSNLVIWYDCKNRGNSSSIWVPAHTISGDLNYTLTLYNNAYWGSDGLLVCENAGTSNANENADCAINLDYNYSNPWLLVDKTTEFTYEILVILKPSSYISSDKGSECFFGLTYRMLEGAPWRYMFNINTDTLYIQYSCSKLSSWTYTDLIKVLYNTILHLTFSKSGDTMKGYLNGLLQNTIFVSSSNYAPYTIYNPLCLGAYAASLACATPCEIYSFRCYNKALSADEVKQTYNFHKDRYNL